MKSLGGVEVSGVVAAVDALDIMCKSADVTLVSWERKLGGRLVTIGTDAHVTKNIASGFNEAKAMLKKIGFEKYHYYKNRNPVEVAL